MSSLPPSSTADRPRSGRTLLGRGALVVLSCTVAICLLEWVCALWLPFGVPLFRLDPELLHTTVPEARRVRLLHRQGRRMVEVALGPEGFRGRAPLGIKVRPRLVVYGDSLVLAESAAEQQTFVRQLELGFAELGVAIEAVNAGVTGYGPDQALLKFLREQADLEPDGVLLVLCAHNDHGDLLRNKLFELDARGELQQRQPVIGPRLVESFAQGQVRSERWALQRLWDVWNMKVIDPPLVDLPARWLAANQRELVDYSSSHRVQTLFEDTYDIDVALGRSWAQTKLDLMEAVLAEWARHCSRLGLPLLAVVIPSAIGVDPDFGIALDPMLFPDHDPGRITAAFDKALGQAGIPALHLASHLDAVRSSDFFIGNLDFHWSVAGQAFAAREVIPFLQRQGWPRSR